MFQTPDLDFVVAAALAEDFGVDHGSFMPGAAPDTSLLKRDVTSYSVIGPDSGFSGRVVARQECVVAGLPVAAVVYERLSMSAELFDPVEFFPLVAEGTHVEAGTAVAEVEGMAVAVLAGERTALDFMMVLSGIATRTAQWVAEAGPGLAVLDTRKTLPGLRELSKYAVVVGGGQNHRSGLYDMVLVKDNHVERAGGMTAAIGRARLHHPGLVVEVEADTIDQALEAVRAGADIVLLDNMDDTMLATAVAECRAVADERGATVLTEASGNIVFERLAGLAATGVDRVSASALTLAGPVDFGLDET